MSDDNSVQRLTAPALAPHVIHRPPVVDAITVLKIAAVATMVIDHSAIAFFGDSMWMRQIGRFAMPLFAGLVGYNLGRTRSVDRYALRLLLLGLVSQPLYVAAFGGAWHELNVGFTLFVGVCAAAMLHNWRVWPLGLALVLVPFIDYGVPGVLYIVAVSFVARYGWPAFVIAVIASIGFNGPAYVAATVCASVLVIATLRFSSSRRWPTRIERIAFYTFYPTHLAGIAVLAFIL
ncbi:TraX family protein [Salinisphaera sp. SPP-AMP-43]|uniref:TraX family protein n=1 Tax=Salinisphaera sp. SPP-AMP-43 TaxID=3121288 RepID=UPI003C6DDEC3